MEYMTIFFFFFFFPFFLLEGGRGKSYKKFIKNKNNNNNQLTIRNLPWYQGVCCVLCRLMLHYVCCCYRAMSSDAMQLRSVSCQLLKVVCSQCSIKYILPTTVYFANHLLPTACCVCVYVGFAAVLSNSELHMLIYMPTIVLLIGLLLTVLDA